MKEIIICIVLSGCWDKTRNYSLIDNFSFFFPLFFCSNLNKFSASKNSLFYLDFSCVFFYIFLTLTKCAKQFRKRIKSWRIWIISLNINSTGVWSYTLLKKFYWKKEQIFFSSEPEHKNTRDDDDDFEPKARWIQKKFHARFVFLWNEKEI